MKHTLILFALALVFGCTQPQPQQALLLEGETEAVIAYRDGVEWVLDQPVVDLANEVLSDASIDSVVFDSAWIMDGGDGYYTVQLHGYYGGAGAPGAEEVVDRILCYEDNDTLWTVDDTYSQAYYTLCTKVLCCAACGKTPTGTCACATESCTGGICSTRTMAAYPSAGVSNGVRAILTQ